MYVKFFVKAPTTQAKILVRGNMNTISLLSVILRVRLYQSNFKKDFLNYKPTGIYTTSNRECDKENNRKTTNDPYLKDNYMSLKELDVCLF